MTKFAAPLVATLAGCVLTAFAQPVETQHKRLFGLSYNPVIESRNNQRLSDAMGYWDPEDETNRFIEQIGIASHEILQFRLSPFLDVDFFPVKADGFQYDEARWLSGNWYQPDAVDYDQVVRDYDLARKTEMGQVDEVGMYGAPYFGYYESRMMGPRGYWCNSPPLKRVPTSKIFIIMGWNYEREVSLHATGHRTESIMSYVYNGWDINRDQHLWDRFGHNVGQTTIANTYGVGTAHFPPNGEAHYDYANPGIVTSYAPDWLNNFPNFQGDTQLVSRDTWGLGEYNNYELEFFKWWYQHMPHVAGRNNLDGYDRLNNWWEYIYNFNAHAESNGEMVLGGAAPPAEAVSGAPVQLTSNDEDHWAPQVTSDGQIVWHGGSNERRQLWYVYTAPAGDPNPTFVSSRAPHMDNVRVNANGQAVWQQFDGKSYDIVTGRLDGSARHSITTSEFNAWHPDISDTGRIVWEEWDGEDYEIFSANFDGSDVVQLTNDAYTSGKRPDDCWPRINANNRVVWMAYDGLNWEIYSADADGGNFMQISANIDQNEYPQINDNNRVVWHAWDGFSSSRTDVFAGNALTGQQIQLSNDYSADWWPQLNNNDDVVWMHHDGNDWEIKRSSALGGLATLVTNNDAHDQYPQINNSGRIVWQGLDGNDWEIYAFESDTIYQLSDNDYHDRWPAQNDAGVTAWHADSNITDAGYPTSQIFTFSPTEILPGDLNCDGAVDFFDIDPFVTALLNAADYADQYPDCSIEAADLDNSGDVDFFDIDPFVDLLTGS